MPIDDYASATCTQPTARRQPALHGTPRQTAVEADESTRNADVSRA